ncbi:MAG: hypothetical protein C5B49_01910 [Bdellovibrio sp.]|nr:MAG: hypothetical protein C5B49_01910 [Bdellovibrio sp.]
MLAITDYPKAPDLSQYEIQPGLLCRHPKQDASTSNPWNYTRDQLLPMIAGLHKQGHIDVVRRVFWSHAKRCFFCQNFEEGLPGTTKRFPDFADPLAPNHIGALILAGNFWYLYWFLPIACLFLVLDLFIRNHNEQNQTVAVCYLYGQWAMRLYRWARPDWVRLNQVYWNDQMQPEYTFLIMDLVTKEKRA